MATRKAFMGTVADRPELDRLLEQAKLHPATDDQLREQRISFAYGNALNDDRITKESVRNASNSFRSMRDFDKWVDQQRIKGFLEHSIRLGDVEAAWNASAEVEREACAKIVEKLAGADAVYPAGIEMIVATIRARSTIT